MAEYRDRRKEEERVKAVRNDRGALMNERSRRVQIERKKKLRKKKQRRRVLVSLQRRSLIQKGLKFLTVNQRLTPHLDCKATF